MPTRQAPPEPRESPEPRYRAQALQALESGERLNTLLPVTKLRLWLLALAAALVVAAVLAYAAVTPRDVTVSGGGRITGENGVALVTSSAAGQFGTLMLDPGTEVKVGDVVAHVVSDSGRVTQRAQTAGILLGYLPRPGDPIDVGEWLAEVSSEVDDGRTAMMMVQPDEAEKVSEGQPVTLNVIGGPSLSGRIGPDRTPALAPDRVQEGLGLLEPPDGPRVIVELQLDETAPRGYEFEATVLVSDRTLLQQLVGAS